MTDIRVFTPSQWTEYELIDSGDGEKLELIGGYTVSRPDPRILWPKSLAAHAWDSADAVYLRSSQLSGSWDVRRRTPDPWRVRWNDITFTLRPTEFKHVGVFPEQAVNWEFMRNALRGNPAHVLNLFAYTGGATLACLSQGAKVTHVDSAKGTVDWAHTNVTASGMEGKPVRWIVEDVMKFLHKEVRRGNTYDGIVMDPPRFGRGTKGEVWKLEKDLQGLVRESVKLLSPEALFFVVNAYTADVSSLALSHLVSSELRNRGGQIESGELALVERASGRVVPSGIVTRWAKET